MTKPSGKHTTKLSAQERDAALTEASAEEVRVNKEMRSFRQRQQEKAEERQRRIIYQNDAINRLSKEFALCFVELSARLTKIEQLLMKERPA
jgi:hypothetical protein